MPTASLRALVPVGSLILLCLALWPPGAATARTPGIPAVDTVQLGPIKAAGGFALYVTAQGCGSATPTLQVAFRTGSAPDVMSHTYTGFTAKCAIERTPAGAQLSARLPGLLNLDGDIAKVGAALIHPGLPVGCGPPFGPELPATATGRIDVAIDPHVFGRIGLRTANAQIFSGAPQQCPAAQPTQGRQLTAAVGPYVLDATAPTHGEPVLDILDPASDSPAPGITGTLQLALSGPHGYALTAANGSARLGSGAPFTRGTLTFAALSACPGATAVNGELSGTLTIRDPLLGALAIVGANAEIAYTGEGTAQPGACNGPGSVPVAPDVVTSCNEPNADCSVSGATNTATVFDETDPGTQTITSEQVNFGDGSALSAIGNYGSVQHTYAQPGTYTVTVTVTDSAQTTTTGTTQVYIEP